MREGLFQRYGWLGKLVALVTAVAIVGLPLLILEVQRDNPPITRLGVTGNRISAMHSDEDRRVLIIDSSSRADARAFPGRVSRPWDTTIDLIVAPANDFAAPGLVEAVERSPDAQIVVAGVPGADQDWLAIERSVHEGSITYVDSFASFELDNSEIFIIGESEEGAVQQGVLVRSNESTLFIDFGGDTSPDFADVVVTAGDVGHPSPITIRPPHLSAASGARSNSVFTIERRETAEVVFDTNAIRLRGVKPQESSN